MKQYNFDLNDEVGQYKLVDLNDEQIQEQKQIIQKQML